MPTTLDDTFQHLQNLPFPEAGEGDDLSDWIGELSEFDGHVAGIASTIISNGSADTSKLLGEAKKLRLQIENVSDYPEEDREIYKSCKKYLCAIEDVIQILTT